jgi:chromosome partitioning protein
MARVIAVVNQKGGVGKTTTVINIGAALTLLGKKVLLVDLDPQGNMSSGLNVSDAQVSEKNTYELLVAGKDAGSQIVRTAVRNLDCVPANTDLAGAEIELVDMPGREFRLKSSFSQGLDAYDYVLMDCPPSLGLLTINALCAADSYLIPMQSEFFAMQGLTNILRTTSLIKQNFNSKLQEEGILLTMFDSRSNLSKQVYSEIREFAPRRLFANVVPRRVRLAESTSHGVPGVIYDPTCFGSRSYLAVAKELILRSQGIVLDAPQATVVPPDPIDRFGKSRGLVEKSV